MLFTEAERAEWKRRSDAEYVEQPGDTHSMRWARKDAVDLAFRNEKMARMRARPERVLLLLVTHTGERARVGITSEESWGEPALLEARHAAANTPETRWLVRTMLEAISKIPRSWGRSATMRFLRGTGKQKGTNYPGAGILSAERGWREYEATALAKMFHEGDFGSLFLSDVSADAYGEEGREIAEEGGNRFAATSKDRDDAFIAKLIGMLDAEGVKAPIIAGKPPPKPRKSKEFKPGDAVTQGNLRDVPTGAHLRMTVAEYPSGPKTGEFEATERTWEMVVESRETGSLRVRPVVSGKAFAPRDFQSRSLYKTGYDRPEVTTVYVGQWAGEVVDVEIARDAWKWTKTRKVRRKRVGTGYPEVFVPA